MSPKETAYHLSPTQDPQTNSKNLYLIASPAFIFNHWNNEQYYLHKIAFDRSDIVDYQEEGHHDVVSSFSTDEYALVNSLEIEESWKLDTPEDQDQLIISDFYNAARASLFSGEDQINRAIISLCSDEVAIDYIKRHLNDFDPARVWEAIPKSRIQLKFQLLKEGFLSENKVAAIYSPRIDWADLADSRAARIEFELNQLFSLERDDSFLFDYLAYNKEIESEKLRWMILIRLFLKKEAIDESLFKDKISLPPEAIIFFLRSLGEDYTLKFIQPRLQSNWKKQQLRYCIDRLTIFNGNNLISFLKALYSEQKDNIDFWHATSNLAKNGDSDIEPNLKSKIKNWQHSNSRMTLSECAELGFIFSIQKILDKQTDESELNKGLLKAAEKGYTDIVKLLHKKGATLSYWSNFTIKYANKFEYKALKEYLIENGVENLNFS